MTNCDVLIDVDFEKVLEYHKNIGNDITIISSLKNIVLPYGVLHTKAHGIVCLME